MLCVLLSGAMLWPMSMIAHAAEAEKQDPYSFDQVVVTATKTPVKEFEANANITVVTKEDIERWHFQDITEALRTVPGVTINNYSNGVGYEQSSHLRINGTEKIVVLIDGVRANVNGSTFNVFSGAGLLSMDRIERIEVLKGSASTLYGADAKGGVINIITRNADANKTSLTVAGGSYSKQQYALLNEGKSGNYSWVFGYQKDISGDYTAGNGVVIPSYRDADSYSFKLTRKIDAKSNLAFNYNNYAASVMYVGTYNDTTGKQDTTKKYGFVNSWDASLTYNYAFSDKVKNQLLLFARRRDTDYDYTSASRWMMKLGSWGIQDQVTIQAGKKHLLVTGYDMFQDQIFDYKDQNSAYTDKNVTNQALFVQDEWSFSNQWKLTTGLRYDMHSTYGNHTTPSINLGYKPTDRTSFYVSYKEFFVVPNQYQLFSPYAPTDVSTLKPETGNTMEFGVNQKLDNSTTASFHIFTRNTKNKIYYDSSNNWKVGNIDQEKANGWDIQLDKKFSKQFSGYISFAGLYVDPNTEYKNPNLNGSEPRGKWNVGFAYQKGKWDLGLQGYGIIDKPGAKINAFPASTYWIWDLSANYKMTKDATLFLKINNIGDVLYAQMSNNSNIWYLSPGRNFIAGVKYSF